MTAKEIGEQPAFKPTRFEYFLAHAMSGAIIAAQQGAADNDRQWTVKEAFETAFEMADMAENECEGIEEMECLINEEGATAFAKEAK